MTEPKQIQLTIEEIPKYWYNILPDLPEPLPPEIVPEPLKEKMDKIYKTRIKACMAQEHSNERYIPIPEEVIDLYIGAGRPTALCRAFGLERFLKTPAHMYYKREDLNPTGSFKLCTALPQAYYAAKEGAKGLCTATGAGQWGTAVAYAAAMTGLKAKIFWVRKAYKWKKERRALMKMYGAAVVPSPSNLTELGKMLLKEKPNHMGSDSIATAEATEYSIEHGYARVVGSFFNHVILHDTIIGLETMKQFELIDEKPNVMVSCCGAGSNLPGFIFPFMREVLKGKLTCKFIAVQSMASPTLIKGEYKYDYQTYSELPPLFKMYTLGHTFEMPEIYAEGLRETCTSPVVSLLRHNGLIDAVAYPVDEKAIFEAAKIFVSTEGFLPAVEAAYSIRGAIDEAIKCKRENKKKVIAFNVTGHGFLDLPAYIKFL
ncbi:MAG: TrpB-like pyridoxal phosphate-dependent enzyme [Candidatus Bathyarchaeia archaeon]